ncbi:MAG: hypothetical protein Q4D25_10025, partial [Bacteroidales bacterium]|nr:hypothetical protein [Bacteroidales bacterium]
IVLPFFYLAILTSSMATPMPFRYPLSFFIYHLAQRMSFPHSFSSPLSHYLESQMLGDIQ